LILSHLKYIFILVLLIVIQTSFIWLISISKFNITPDLVLIAVIFIAIQRGRIEGMIYGFFAGLLMDFLAGSFIGLSALSYSIAGFIAGFFQKESPADSHKKVFFLSVLSICTFAAYFLFFMIYFQGAGIPILEIILNHVLTTTIYTTIFGFIFIIILSLFEAKQNY
jgi:rod shape-determining protein MreD